MTWASMSGAPHTPNGTLQNNQNGSLFPDVDYPRQPSTNGSVLVNLGPQKSKTEAYTPPRYRGGRDAETPNWDDEAALRLRNTLHPPGDAYDYLALFRKPFGLRKPNMLKVRHGPNETRPFGVAWLVRDPCGIVCIVVTWLLIFYAELVISAIIFPRVPSTLFCWINGPIFHILSFLAFMSHVKAFSTNPGTIPIGNATTDVLNYLQETYGDEAPTVVRCPKCLCIKPARTHHCRVCSRCVRKMDHHCPWINNCVGEANQKYFVLFTLYICLQSLFALYICIHYTVICVATDWEQCQYYPDRGGLSSVVALPISSVASGAFILGLILEAVVFGLFTLIMCIGQVYSIADDETGIESLGRIPPKREHRSRWKNIVATCGHPFSWHWFSPFDSPPPLMPIFPEFKSDICPLLSSNSTLEDGSFDSSSNSRLWLGTHAHRLDADPEDILTL